MLRLKVEEVHWELTNHCNLRCVHCYLAKDPRRELTTDEIRGLLDQLEETGCLVLTLSGGEPLLRRDFAEIYSHAHARGFLINIFTSGTRMTPKLIELFQAKRPRMIEITVNGATAETFERVTAIPGSYEKCMQGIRMILDAGLPLTLKTNGMKLNRHELAAIKAFARGLPGVQYKFDTEIMPRRDHDLAPTRLRLRPDEVIALYKEDPEMGAQLREECGRRDSEHAQGPEVGDGWSAPVDRMAFQCAAGRTRYHISAWGDLHPCHTVRPLRVSLLEHRLAEAMARLREQVDGIKLPEDSPCGSCKIHGMCSRCPGANQLETRSSLLRVDDHCELTHKVVENFG